jgi:hypothetical protein
MAKYRLLNDHYLNNQFLVEGVVVSDKPDDGEVFYDGRPSKYMEGLDAEGKKAVENLSLSRRDPRSLKYVEKSKNAGDA